MSDAVALGRVVAAGQEAQPREEAGRIDPIAGAPRPLAVPDLRHEAVVGAEAGREVVVLQRASPSGSVVWLQLPVRPKPESFWPFQPA